MVKLPFNLKDIKPGEFVYFTKRKIQNNKGEETGEVFVWKRRDDEVHSFMMKCPYCQSEGDGKVDLKKRPYRMKCTSCDRTVTLKKLKDEV